MNSVVTVVIPTYRRVNSLQEALTSVCNQSYPFVEIIVVDDNAEKSWNEKVKTIVDEFICRIPESCSLRLIVNPINMGAAASRNNGIQAASGSYITFLDDDDLYLPEKISVQLLSMQEAGADYSLMDLVLFNDEGQVVERKTHPYIHHISETRELVRLHLLHHMTGTDTMMFRKEYLLQIGCFGVIDIGDEFYLMMNAIEGKGVFLYIPQALVHARVHYDGSGLSGGPLKLQGEELLFRFKQKYFHELSGRDIRYIRMRHHAVLAFAHLKAKNRLSFLREAGYSLLIFPFGCIRMLYRLHANS